MRECSRQNFQMTGAKSNELFLGMGVLNIGVRIARQGRHLPKRSISMKDSTLFGYAIIALVVLAITVAMVA